MPTFAAVGLGPLSAPYFSPEGPAQLPSPRLAGSRGGVPILVAHPAPGFLPGRERGRDGAIVKPAVLHGAGNRVRVKSILTASIFKPRCFHFFRVRKWSPHTQQSCRSAASSSDLLAPPHCPAGMRVRATLHPIPGLETSFQIPRLQPRAIRGHKQARELPLAKQ